MNRALVDMTSELRGLRGTEIVVTGATIEGVPVRLGAREMRVRRVGGRVRLLMLLRLLVRPSISLALKSCSVFGCGCGFFIRERPVLWFRLC